ncbi:unnamed protein product, partial [Cyprideis torosa]
IRFFGFKVVEPNDFADIIGLTSRPPARFSKFIIRRSQLTELPSEALGVIHADEYIIENNPLMESIIQGALGVNANPKVISIRNNPLLEDIPFEDFKSFSNLEIVNMQDNRILDVPDFAFDGISNKLREINFQRNVILDVGVFAFRNLPALETIDLSQNQLGELGASSLFFTTAPRVVNLSGNRIANLDADTFTNPNQPSTGAYVKTLDLSNNAISRLNYADIEPIFRRLDALKMSADPPTTTTTAPPFNPFAQQGFGQQPFGFQNQQQNPFAALQQQHPQQQPSVPSLLGGGIPTPVEPPTQPPPPPVPSPTEPQIPITRPTAAAGLCTASAAVLSDRAGLPRTHHSAGLVKNATVDGAKATWWIGAAWYCAEPCRKMRGRNWESRSAALILRFYEPVTLTAILGLNRTANPFGSNDLLQRIFERLSQLTGAGVAPTTTEPPTTTTQAPTTTTEPPAPVSTTEDAAKLIFKLRQELLQAIKSNPTAAAAAGNAVLAAAQAAQTKPKKKSSKSKSSADPLVDAATESPAANAVRRKRQAPNLTAEQLRSFFPGGQLPPGLVALFGQQGNPFMCDCESKWLYDFRLKYADQIFGLTCIENGQNVFTLPETHFTQC